MVVRHDSTSGISGVHARPFMSPTYNSFLPRLFLLVTVIEFHVRVKYLAPSKFLTHLCGGPTRVYSSEAFNATYDVFRGLIANLHRTYWNTHHLLLSLIYIK
jgi:hypothetical protein